MSLTKRLITLTTKISAVSMLAPLAAPTFFNLYASDFSFGGEGLNILGDSSALKITNLRASGKGSFVLKTPLTVIGDASSHALSFALSDGASMNYVAYSDEELKGGLNFQFQRLGKTLQVNIESPGHLGQSQDISKNFEWVDASRLIDLQIDTHNDENPCHILIWDGLEKRFTEENAKFNSEDVNLPSKGQGAGIFRGLILNNATVFKAVPGAPKFTHDH